MQTTVKRVFNFSAGPGVLPEPVLERAREELLCLPGAGASVMELSHRGSAFIEVYQKTCQNFRTLLGVGEEFEVLFLQGGASTQFMMLPFNFAKGKKVAYAQAGAWGKKAVDQAKPYAQEVQLAFDGSPEGFVHHPSFDQLSYDKDVAYLHLTSNETIEGVEFFQDPSEVKVPVVCDMSSDFMSRPIDMSAYDMIYAGAQKNVGPAGVTVVLMRKSFLEKQVAGEYPAMLDYKVQLQKQSAYNTPPTFAIYMVGLVTDWLLHDIGGLKKMQKINQEKAALLYDVIDEYDSVYEGHAKRENRSLMNVTFRLKEVQKEDAFVQGALAKDLHSLKGHRSVGGLRASIYNAMPIEGVKALAQYMREFAQG